MRVLIIVPLLLLVQACWHPLQIAGEGDIVERLNGVRGCTLEEFQSESTRCTQNDVTAEDYIVSYEAIPRPGWVFDRWDGLACEAVSVAPYCEYNVLQKHVDLTNDTWPGLAWPALIAVFKPDSDATVTISGNLSFDYYPATVSGLDYSAREQRPIRGAVVQLIHGDDLVLAQGNSLADGSYSLQAPANTQLALHVRAALGPPDSPDTEVVNNTAGQQQYGATQSLNTGSSDAQIDIHASATWNGGYSGDRLAAPFAILDTLYQAQKLIRNVDGGVVFPKLLVNWSPQNKPVEANFNVATGDLPGSYYLDGQLYILGAENLDTDEYDAMVVAQEWVHYFEHKFSRSDSIGGEHGPKDILDPAVAFGEGFGTAMAGKILGNSTYVDTGGMNQAELNVIRLLDSNSGRTGEFVSNGALVDGFYSEASIWELLYDLTDGGAGDDDAVSIGFAPIYRVLTGGQKNTPSIASIFSFLHHLKLDRPALATAIDDLAAGENIFPLDEYEDTNNSLYTDVPPDGTVVTMDPFGLTLLTVDSFGEINANNRGGNKLYNRVYFRSQISQAGCYTVQATPVNSGQQVFVKSPAAQATLGDALLTSFSRDFANGDAFSFTVGALAPNVEFTVRIFPSSNCGQ